MKRSVYRPLHGGNLVWAASLANCSPSAILDFSASINPLGPPASAIATLQSHLADLKTYPDPQYHQLRSALSQFHHIPPAWILPGNGAAELLTWACRDLAKQSVTCLITPAFGDYSRALNAFEARIKEFLLASVEYGFGGFSPKDLGFWGFDWRTYLQTLNLEISDPTVGLLMNNPHNPTGVLFPKEVIQEALSEFALVVVDEAFMDFLPPEEHQSMIDAVQNYPNLVVLRSLTKFYSLPGLRLGYAIAHPDRLQRWQQWRDPWSVNALAAAVGEVVVQDIEFQQQTWNWLTQAKRKLFQGLEALPGLTPQPGVANFLLVQSSYSVMELQIALLERHQILIRDCMSFPALGDRYFRVAVRTEEENQRLLTGLAEVLGEWGVGSRE
ncbi:threonine-phosphate decarboxylase CobD [Kovacikia minuta CCNUW1]|uniref:threonine-phosphate decarboxylase CobD n=1 Tax=Kovacikia minuta TaxID=2931930 RepID=UPI001CCE8229|nr:threonine-phosphate decarboxylase CobD [Kovacikia minuta]UBF26971.1 threonine-phosphate decarboxylase CobD [Kovacikia minuta CCNUW1]